MPLSPRLPWQHPWLMVGANQKGGLVQLAMERRRFIMLTARGMLAVPSIAEGQPNSKVPKVAVFSPGSATLVKMGRTL